jgi:hypothetical protein
MIEPTGGANGKLPGAVQVMTGQYPAEFQRGPQNREGSCAQESRMTQYGLDGHHAPALGPRPFFNSLIPDFWSPKYGTAKPIK